MDLDILIPFMQVISLICITLVVRDKREVKTIIQSMEKESSIIQPDSEPFKQCNKVEKDIKAYKNLNIYTV